MGWLPASIRADTARRLIGYNTLAGPNVEENRATEVSAELRPFLAVYVPTHEAEVQSMAGSEPRFSAKLHLAIEAIVGATPLAAAVAQLDTLVGQVTDGLISDTAWWLANGLTRVGSITVTTRYSSEAETFTGIAQIAMILEYAERYPQRVGTPLSAVDLTTTVGDQQTKATIVISSS